MATHSLTALVEQRYGGKQLKPGDQFEAETSHARMLVAIKRAKFNEDKAAAKPGAKRPPATKASTPAEQTTEPEPTAEPQTGSTAVPGMTTKQVYKRRDLTPE